MRRLLFSLPVALFVIDKAGRIRRHYGAPLTADQVRNDLLPLLRELARG